MSINSFYTFLKYLVLDLCRNMLKRYITTRDTFDAAGGQTFIRDRRKVRADYCKKTISPQTIQKWICRLPNKTVQDEFRNR